MTIRTFLRARPLALALSVLVALPAPVHASNTLPDIGTAAVDSLSLDKEREYGAAYMMQLRASAPIIQDPVLTDYVSDLGYQLLRHADRLDHRFHFFVINNPEINAFAFFGGHVGIHTGLFLHADQESQLASVLAHEIAHVTQRHLARMIAEQERNTPLTVAGVLGSILLAVAAPGAGMAGMAGMSATMAASQQSSINFTRLHEQEADRLGMRMLTAAGFDAWGMPDFFTKMAAQYRFASKPPQMLLTHPLTESRITDSRNRAADFARQPPHDEPLFQLARARVVVRYGGKKAEELVKRLSEQQARGERPFGSATPYALALALTDAKRYEEAKALLLPMLKTQPDNLFYLDTLSDIATGSRDYDLAQQLLEEAARLRPHNNVITINLANLLITRGQHQPALTLLERYQQEREVDDLVLGMLETCYAKLNQEPRRQQIRAERLGLVGNFPQAIEALQTAHSLYGDNAVEQLRIEARILQFKEQEQWLRNL
ncbi:MAG: M48 family metallopeptidase [Gammaproteobacteria bacterium]|nr:M48 family metallopeptidase [Gammaproteobacteria bacterium]